MNWDQAVAFALSLPNTELSTSYGNPAVKVASNGRAFLVTSHESETSFGLSIDLDTVDLLMATEPETYWRTPHYEGYPMVLVRYAAADEERVAETIRRSRDYCAALPKARSRKRK
ncbi:hypothetical protein ACUXST_000097 [Sphingomonas sp. F9_3S_D5_B_2]